MCNYNFCPQKCSILNIHFYYIKIKKDKAIELIHNIMKLGHPSECFRELYNFQKHVNVNVLDSCGCCNK